MPTQFRRCSFWFLGIYQIVSTFDPEALSLGLAYSVTGLHCM